MSANESVKGSEGTPLNEWNGGPLVVVFFIALEQPLMVAEGITTFAHRRDEPVPWVEFASGTNFVAIRIWRREVERLFDFKYMSAAFKLATELVVGEAPGEPSAPFGNVPWPSSTYMGSIAEVATPLLPTADLDIEHAVSDAFDRCIEELHGFSLAYQSVTKDRRFRPVTRQTCPMIVPFCFQTKDDATYFGLSNMTIHTGDAMPFEPEELSADQLREFQATWLRRRTGDPFSSYVDWSRSAHRSLNLHGDYAQSVIATHTAVEVLINSVLLMCAWERQYKRSEVRSWFEESTGFLARSRKHLRATGNRAHRRRRVVGRLGQR